jgi:hypothetical protein
MIQQGQEVLKEFVRRVNALLDRLQKAAGLGEGAMNQADLDVLAVASAELLTNTLANMPEPMRSDRLKAFSETLAADVAKKRERLNRAFRKVQRKRLESTRRSEGRWRHTPFKYLAVHEPLSRQGHENEARPVAANVLV